MNTIKLTSKTTLKLNGTKYKGYLIGEIPPSFGYKEKWDGVDKHGNDKFKKGTSEWFNYKGLTWVIDKEHWSKWL